MRDWIRGLPRGVTIAVWGFGLFLVLVGELLAVWSVVPGDTISESVWEIAGIGEPITPITLVVRVGVIGFLGWMILHFMSKRV